GVAEYVPPPGSQQPIVSNPSPADGATNVPISLNQLSFALTDFQKDPMNYSVTTSPYIGSGSGIKVNNGRYTVPISDLEYATTYTWRVSVTDGKHWTNVTYTFTTQTMPPWYNTQWQYRKTITIDPSQVSGDQTNFPVLIDMVDSDLKGKAQPDGDDIVFVSENNVKLSHEIEQYESSTGHLVAWVRIPFVSSTSFTTFYMYYGNPTAPNQEDTAAVWDTSYKLVLHLNEEHECRMWAMISDSGLPHDTVEKHLITDPHSLEALSSSNRDGWGMVWYNSADFEQRRGTPPAYTDPNYRPAVYELADSGATIGVAHIRAASSGNPTGIPDPHPFTRTKNGKTWSLAHNGVISKSTLKTLINNLDPTYLSLNPPNIGDWNIENSYVDSDLYMAYIMLCIERSNWDVLTGLAYVLNTVPSGSGNIILTDGTTIWAYANGQTLTSYYSSTTPTYSVVASQNPDPAQTGWTSMSSYNLVILTRKNAPIFISDIRQYKLLTDPTFDACADSDALRANGAGQDWYESRNDVPTLLYLDTTNVGGNTGKKAGFTASSSGNAYCTQEFGVPQTGVFSVQWDIYVDSILNIDETDRAGWMMIGDNYDTSTANYQTPNNPPAERFVYMAFYKNGGGTSGTMDLVAKTIGESFNSHTVIASGLNLKQWYTIKVVVDVAAKSYDVYVNGVFMAHFVTDFARDSVTHISFAQWNDGAGAFYVDNVYAPAPISTHTLTINIVGDGTVTKNPDAPTYAYGTSVQLTAIPNAGYSFAGWTGDYEGSANPVTIMMDRDKEITATFVKEVYTLSVNVVGSGTVTKNPNLPTYNYGDTVILTANPSTGYKFVAWSGDLSGTANPATITMTGNKAVTATFLSEDAPVCIDSSSYGHIGILYGGVTQGATGVIDGAYTFDGINDYIQFAHSNALTGYTTSFTASFWLRLDDVSKRQAILNKYETAGNQRGWYIEFQTHATYGKVLGFFASQDGSSYREWYASFNPTAGTWYYITVVWQANTIPKFYVNGIQVATIGTSTLASIYNNAAASLYVGRSYTTGRYLKGSLDEIRIISPAKSANYILTSYNNQKNPSLFCQVGPEQSLPATPIISNPNPANGATNVPITISKLSFNLIDYQNDLMDYTVTTDPDIGSATVTGVTSGTHSISVSGLQYGTTYTWEVSVTDGTHSTTATYTFTTLTPLLVDSEFNDSADSADLRTNGAGQDWYESRADGTSGPLLLTLNTDNIGGNAGKKAGFTASSSYNAYCTQEFSSPQTGIFSVQWDIYVDSILNIASPDRAGIMLIGADLDGSGGPNRNDAERFVFLAFWKDGGATSGPAQLVWMDTFSIFTPIASVNLDQWYTIKVIVNVPAKTYDVYLDGVYINTVPACTELSSVTHISFAQWNDGAGAFYVDNVFSPAIDRYKLTVNAVGSGSVSRSPGESTYTPGTLVTLTATPEPGWYFSGWSGDISSNDNPIDITMD
ncbi:DUF2341 domain-containing protein, partial [Candidatus Bathyarchaeota archaeon A05DMB-2]|nr:DUF2341 domain-containing protein [Candidatus Bathyarchaeota archaeon A05DMB-2]